MKKSIFIIVLAILIAVPLYFGISNLRAEPVKDYSNISSVVKLESYRLSRGGDIFQALQASAAIVSPGGMLLTNSHAVLDSENDPYDAFAVCLTFDKNQEPVCEYTALLMAYDRNLDLALLRLKEQDNRGNLLPALAFLPYDFAAGLEIGQSMDIFGYPDTGGKTLTQTRGQVAGFELKNGVSYLKTDADISSGNSGGAAVDEKGNFIGVPTYVISSLDNLGYVLDIKQAAGFINQHSSDEPAVNKDAQAKLEMRLNFFNDAKDSGRYQHPYYPKFSLSLPAGWEWEEIDNNYLGVISRSNEGDKKIELTVFNEPYKIHEDYLKEVMHFINLYTDYLTDYKKQAVTFAGAPATLLTYNAWSEKHFAYLIPYGHALLQVKYSISLENYDKDYQDYEAVLQSFSFVDQPVDNPQIITTLFKSDPPFAVSRSGDWLIQRSRQPQDEELIATLENPRALRGQMQIYYRELDNDQKGLDNQQLMQQQLLAFQQDKDRKLINKNEDIILDNLSGWSITYTEPGFENETVNKTSHINLRDGNYLYDIIYTNISDQYGLYLEDFNAVLKSFKNYRQPAANIGKGEYRLGTFDYVYKDISFHRFEQSITKLADEGIVYGYTDDSFRPEKIIVAAEVKKFIQNSLAQTKRASFTEEPLSNLPAGEITAALAVETLGRVFKLDTWPNPDRDASSWKPYWDKAWQLSLIPAGLYDPQAPLTRAEFTYILDQLLSSFEVI